MIILTNTTDKVQVKLAGAITTNQLPCFASYRDTTSNSISALRNGINTNNTTAVDLLGSPAVSTQRIVDYISVYNADTVAATVTVQFNDNATTYNLCTVILGVGERLEYQEQEGFKVTTSTGAIRVIDNLGAPSAQSAVTFVLKATDQTNSTTSFASITGLSFAVSANRTYWFKFIIPYTSNATTNGSRFAVDGPINPITLYYYTDVANTTNTKTLNRGITSYDGTITSAQSASTTGNVATIEGIITPSTSGTLIARFASEVAAGNSITQKAGAHVQYLEI